MIATILGGVLLLLIGLAFTFLGYRMFLVMLPILGFFAGFWLGANALTLLFGDGFLATGLSWIVGFVLGLLVALLSYLFYFLGVAIVAGIIGYGLGVSLMGLFGLDGGLLVFIVGIVFALTVIVLTLALNLQKYIVILLTALGGGVASIVSVLVIFNQVSLQALRESGNALAVISDASTIWLILALVLGSVGIVWQIRSNRSYEFKKEYYVQSWG